jgi:hypothetical protein
LVFTVATGGQRYLPPIALPLRTRFAAWLVTGPVGHLVGGGLDWLQLLAGYLWARARGRDPWRAPE